jgi:phosphatidylserine decarboxylase
MGIVKLLPLAHLSWLVGVLVHIRLPGPLATLSVRIFAWLYGIDPALATQPLKSYRSIGEFFTRDLRPELRPIQAEVVLPVDGALRSVTTLAPGALIPQVKGKAYSLEKLLGGDPFVARLSSGVVWNMYLSPRDAHHIFAPVSGAIVRTVHIPGALWPVNDWALHSVDELFAVNERVVTFIESAHGLVAVVMVGATNVGRIALTYTDLETNLRPWEAREIRSINHEPTCEVRCGEKIGTFKMGSSVILIMESAPSLSEARTTPRLIQYGQPLL